jgi:hypothetical protein
MKKLQVISLIMGVLVLAHMNFENVGLMAAEHDVRASFSMARSLPEAPGSMMIYETVTPEMSESDVKTLMKACGIEGKVTDRQRQYVVREGKKVLEIFKEPGTGYLRFSNDAQLGTEQKAENLPSRDEAVEKAKAVLEAQGLLHDNMFLIDVSYFESAKYDPQKETIEEGKSAITVGFGFTLEGLRVEGPGAKASVVFGANSEIIGISWIWRKMKPYKKVKIISPDEAFTKFKRRWPAEGDPEQMKQAAISTRVNIKDVRLTYFAEPGCIPQMLVKPVYIFEGDFVVTRGAGEDAAREGDSFVIVVPAVPGEEK